jgi:glycerol uptake facilitator-like aquaporin
MDENRKTTASKTTERARAQSPFGNDKNSTAIKVATGAAVAGGMVAIGKRVSLKGILIAIVAFIVAAALGAVICFFMGKNDTFEINGSEELMLTIGETYEDEGVFVKEFGLFPIFFKSAILLLLIIVLLLLLLK